MPAEICEEDVESLRLPKDWHSYVRNAVLNVIGIVRIAMLAGREALIQKGDVKDARIHQLESELAMTREELRINGGYGCSVSIRTDDRNTPALNGWPSWNYGRCVVGTKRKRLAISLFPMIPSERGSDELMMIRWFRPERL